MTAFATVDDYVLLCGGTVVDEERVEALLEHAGAFLELELARSKKAVDEEDQLQAEALLRISCRLVHDMVEATSNIGGVSQSSMTVGPFTGSWSYVNPTGAFKLLPSERLSLGIGTARAGSVEPRVVRDG